MSVKPINARGGDGRRCRRQDADARPDRCPRAYHRAVAEPKNIAYPAAEIAIASANYLRNCLMDGYTTIREAGGADHATARLLAEGTSSAHDCSIRKGADADRRRSRFPDAGRGVDPSGHVGPFSTMSVIADGTDEVRKAAREELRKGATQIKVFASGGVVFPAEGHATRYEFAEEELSAVVEEAAAAAPTSWRTSIPMRECGDASAGVRSIEHANFVNEETVAMMAESARSTSRPSYRSCSGSRAPPRRICRKPSSRTCSARSTAAGKSMDGPASTRCRSASAPTYGVPTRRNHSCENSKCGRTSTPGRHPALGHRRQCRTADGEGHARHHRRRRLRRPAGRRRRSPDRPRGHDEPQKNLKLIMKDGAIYKNELAGG